MSTLAKMMLMRGGGNRMDGNRDTGAGSVTGGGSGNYNDSNRMERGEMRYEGDTEMARRRRYSDGRFAPRSEMRGGEMRRDEMRRIGFEMGEDEEPEMRYPMWPPMYENHYGESHGKTEQMRGKGSGTRFLSFDRKLADRWVEAMQEEAGKELWGREEVEKISRKYGMDDLDKNEFYAVFNAVYTDFCDVAKKWDVDKAEFFADLARAFIEDEDAVGDKVAAYYACVVRHD